MGDQQQQWIIKIKNEMINNNVSDASAHWSKRSIYKVPKCVTDLNERAYKPHVVSFGPYHHGEDNLRVMEEHKRRALRHFMKRSRNVPLETYVDALTPLVQDLKDAYDQLDHIKWPQDTFLELMIMDGCFILEIMRTSTTETTTTTTNIDIHDPDDYATNEPIFSNHGKLHIVPYVKRDMLMLENQLPIMVLEILFAVQNEHNSVKQDNKLTKLILDFFYDSVEDLQVLQQFSECLHILDVYRKSLLLEPHHQGENKKNVNHQGGGGDGHEFIHSAMELIRVAGIRFEKSKTRSLKDISFIGGILKLPLIVVDDAMESLYLNLIAFERYHGAGNEVTSYIFFMDTIIYNARDVTLLHSCDIIQNALGSDKAVANLFNSLSKDSTLDPESSVANVHNMVSAYCQESWHQWRAYLHNYFDKPWAIISVCAAILLFALTFVQTVYSVLSYFKESPH